jgi:hypothetical protein
MSTMHPRFFATLLAIVLSAPSLAQVQRQFPPTALRGQLVFGQPPHVALNGEPKQLAPGARIRAQSNMIVLSGSLAGSTEVVHYTIDPQGQLKDVWILRPDELANLPWPSTPSEALAWSFDAIAQRWIKP